MQNEFKSLNLPKRRVGQAMHRGAFQRCPNCGVGRIFRAYLKVADHCPHCAEALHHQRADDAPPYVTIFAVGHVIIPLVLAVKRIWQPDYWVHAALWLPLTLLLALSFLPIAKGAIVGLQWALYMHGFDSSEQGDPQIDATWSGTRR